jgi:hypothetical protein
MTKRLHLRIVPVLLVLSCILTTSCANSTLRLAQLSKTGQDIGTQLQKAEIDAHSKKLILDENHNKYQTFFELFGKETLVINNAIRAGSVGDIKLAGHAILDGIGALSGLNDNPQFAIWITVLQSTFATILAVI